MKWFYLVNGQESGPVDPTTLKTLAASGKLKPADKVRREDMNQWAQAQQVKGLFESPKANQITSPGVASETSSPTSATVPSSSKPTITRLDGAKIRLALSIQCPLDEIHEVP